MAALEGSFRKLFFFGGCNLKVARVSTTISAFQNGGFHEYPRDRAHPAGNTQTDVFKTCGVLKDLNGQVVVEEYTANPYKPYKIKQYFDGPVPPACQLKKKTNEAYAWLCQRPVRFGDINKLLHRSYTILGEGNSSQDFLGKTTNRAQILKRNKDLIQPFKADEKINSVFDYLSASISFIDALSGSSLDPNDRYQDWEELMLSNEEPVPAFCYEKAAINTGASRKKRAKRGMKKITIQKVAKKRARDFFGTFTQVYPHSKHEKRAPEARNVGMSNFFMMAFQYYTESICNMIENMPMYTGNVPNTKVWKDLEEFSNSLCERMPLEFIDQSTGEARFQKPTMYVSSKDDTVYNGTISCKELHLGMYRLLGSRPQYVYDFINMYHFLKSSMHVYQTIKVHKEGFSYSMTLPELSMSTVNMLKHFQNMPRDEFKKMIKSHKGKDIGGRKVLNRKFTKDRSDPYQKGIPVLCGNVHRYFTNVALFQFIATMDYLQTLEKMGMGNDNNAAGALQSDWKSRYYAITQEYCSTITNISRQIGSARNPLEYTRTMAKLHDNRLGVESPCSLEAIDYLRMTMIEKSRIDALLEGVKRNQSLTCVHPRLVDTGILQNVDDLGEPTKVTEGQKSDDGMIIIGTYGDENMLTAKKLVYGCNVSCNRKLSEKKSWATNEPLGSLFSKCFVDSLFEETPTSIKRACFPPGISALSDVTAGAQLLKQCQSTATPTAFSFYAQEFHHNFQIKWKHYGMRRPMYNLGKRTRQKVEINQAFIDNPDGLYTSIGGLMDLSGMKAGLDYTVCELHKYRNNGPAMFLSKPLEDEVYRSVWQGQAKLDIIQSSRRDARPNTRAMIREKEASHLEVNNPEIVACRRALGKLYSFAPTEMSPVELISTTFSTLPEAQVFLKLISELEASV